MLAKCTNPSCCRPFLRLNEGTLFGLEVHPDLAPFTSKATEYFWLCDDCSSELTLRLAQDGRVVATDLERAPPDDPEAAFVSLHRESGSFLRRVAFHRSSDSRLVEGGKRRVA
jgi:hypothetical protein